MLTKVVNNGPNVINLIKEQPLICSDLPVETTLVQVLILIYYINVFNKIAIVFIMDALQWPAF